MPHDKVYFVIVSWNNIELLPECLDSIQKQTYKYCETIVVDNGSKDKSVKLLKDNYPSVKVIETGKNNGFAIGNNIGIKKALEDRSCTYIALLNTDARLKPNWTQTLVDFAGHKEKVACLQSPTYDYYDHTFLDSRGITIDHAGSGVQLGYRQRHYTPRTERVFGVNAAAALLTRGFLENQPFGDDYFDSDLWMYLEDVDLAARSVVLGWNNWCVAGTTAYHMGSVSSNKNPGFAVFHIYRNNLLVLIKNFSLLTVCRLLPGLIFTDIRTMLTLLRSRNLSTLRAMIKGRLASFRYIPLFRKKYSTLNQHQKSNIRDIWYLMSQR